MKQLIVYCLVFLVSCKTFTGTDNLAGMYTAYHEHEFGKTQDTLMVTHANDGDNIYNITRHSGLVRTINGKIFPKKLMVDSYVARYNDKDKILQELRTGKIFIYNSQKQILVLGGTGFMKQQEYK